MNKEDHAYNVCAYINGERVMKELVSCKTAAKAREMGLIILRERGFNPSKVRLEVVPLGSAKSLMSGW